MHTKEPDLTTSSSPMPQTAAVAPAATALHDLVLSQLDDDQAQDVISIPLAGKSAIADFMVIASGRSTRHVAAIASKLAERAKHECRVLPRVEGLSAADWVLLDLGDVIVHVFRPEVRSFYNLERMWGIEGPDAPAVPSADPTTAD